MRFALKGGNRSRKRDSPPMRRCMLYISSGVSLLLCLGLFVAWIDSHLAESGAAISLGTGEQWVIFSSAGCATVSYTFDYPSYPKTQNQPIFARPRPLYIEHARSPFSAPPYWGTIEWWKWGGFEFAYHISRYANSNIQQIPLTNELRIPYWFQMLVAGVLPSLWWIRARERRRRTRHNLCAGCGYDLRATRTRCPECGRMVNAVAVALPHG